MNHEFSDLQPDETDLLGQWLDTGSRVEGDAVCERIRWLTEERLHEVARGADGRSALYLDLRDGRYWELTHPHGELRGGGPPRLSHLSPTAAKARYGGIA